ncbi:MAG: hypothetical protein HND47_21375 [Chloroflexi bacterium]|nr:hypothetical protein [Chloroflexota bacterium]
MMTLRRFFVGGLMILIAATSTACSRSERRVQVPESPSAPESANGILPGNYVEEIVIDGQTRQYRLHVPSTYEAGKPAPLVINLHGLNSNAEQQEHVSQMSVKADEAGFIVVYPEGLGNPQIWHVGPRAEGAADLQFIRDLIRRLQQQLSIDPARIYATGISNGAQMTNRLGCEMSDVIAVIAPVSGGYPPTDDCHPMRPVPLVAFHGTDDQIPALRRSGTNPGPRSVIGRRHGQTATVATPRRQSRSRAARSPGKRGAIAGKGQP